MPSLELMERAGAAVAAQAARMAPEGLITVLAGKGNNGGDGLVAARLLRERGREVAVLLTGDPAGDARHNLERLPGPAPLAAGGRAARRDGAGDRRAARHRSDRRAARGDRRGDLDERRRRRCSRSTCRAASTPRPARSRRSPCARRRPSPSTPPSPGCAIEPGRCHAGRVIVVDIGIPDGAPAAFEVGLIRDAVLDGIPRRGVGSTKFTSGRVLVAGGSRRPDRGALPRGARGRPRRRRLRHGLRARLARGDLRGAAARDDDARAPRRGRAPTARRASRRSPRRRARAAARSCSARASGAAAAPRRSPAAVPGAVSLPIVLDADGLNAFAGEPEALAGRRRDHPARGGARAAARTALGRDRRRAAAQRARSGDAQRCRRRAQGRRHARGAPRRPRRRQPGRDARVSRPPAPATCWPGCSERCSRRASSHSTAACAGVRLHALAALRAAALRGAEGLIASDVIDALAAVRR